MSTISDSLKLLDGLAVTPARLEDLLRDADDALWDTAQAGEWSVRTIVAHLRDDEFMVMRLRLIRMVVEEQPTLAPFDEKAWAAKRWTGRDARQELLDDFSLQRETSMSILRRLQAEDWQRNGLQPELGTFDVRWWIQHWLEHDATHIAQIEATLAWARG